jgi:hypothetical protein
MPAPTSNIKGTFVDSQGAPRDGIRISFEPLDTPFTEGDEIIISELANIQLSPNGKFGDITDDAPYNVLFTLVRGTYRVIVSDIDAFIISVPGDGGTHDISDLGVEGGSDERLRSIVSATDLGSLLIDSQSVTKSLKGDNFQFKERLLVLGEGTVRLADDFLHPLYWALRKFTYDPDTEEYTPHYSILSLGNMNEGGSATTIDDTIGEVFNSYIADERFYYCLGDQDWANDNITADWLAMTANYYKVTLFDGNVDLFIISSDNNEPDGNTQGSTQGLWLQTQLAASTAKFKVVAFNDAPDASVDGYSFAAMDWPFATWGANLVLCSGVKIYERIELAEGVWMVVNGVTADDDSVFDSVGTPIDGSEVRADTGAQGILVLEANETQMRVRHVSTAGSIIDDFTIDGPDTQNLTLRTKIKPSYGIRVGEAGHELDFGTADNQVLSGPEIYLGTKTGKIIRVDTVPDPEEIMLWPHLHDCIWMVGDDPCQLYYWNASNQSVDLLLTAPNPSYHNGSKTRLAVPTITVIGTEDAAMGATLDHTDTTVEIHYSLDGQEFFTQIPDWTTNPMILNSTDKPWWLAAFARKSGYIDSYIVYRSFRPNFKQGE